MFSVGIVIPAYNEEKCITRTIESLRSQTYLLDQIIVVDDCSTDRTKEIAGSYKEVDVITTKENQGTKALAQNYVLSMIRADIVVTVDGDTVLARDAVEQLVKAFEQDPKLFSVCGFVMPQEVKTVWERGRFIEYLYGITLHKNIQKEYNAVLVCSGCLSAFNTKKLKEYGGFKDRTMAEDMDLTWEVLLAGERVTYAADAICYPLEPHDFRTFCSQLNRWYSSFFQNVAIHKKELALFKKPMLSLFVLNGLVEGILFPLIILLCAIGLTAKILAAILVIDMAIVLVPVIIKSIKLGTLRLALTSMPAYLFVTRWVGLILFLKAFVNEWLIGNRLTTWEKGH